MHRSGRLSACEQHCMVLSLPSLVGLLRMSLESVQAYSVLKRKVWSDHSKICSLADWLRCQTLGGDCPSATCWV